MSITFLFFCDDNMGFSILPIHPALSFSNRSSVQLQNVLVCDIKLSIYVTNYSDGYCLLLHGMVCRLFCNYLLMKSWLKYIFWEKKNSLSKMMTIYFVYDDGTDGGVITSHDVRTMSCNCLTLIYYDRLTSWKVLSVVDTL